tara:strand:+ start:260 stop:1261 length:1002 start_codon:yes stop_codon:yes gene_type:complete
MKSIVIAVFIKEDLIQKQIDNILQLEKLEEYQIIFIQDNIKNSIKYNNPDCKLKWENVKKIIRTNLHKFSNCELYQLDNNYHPSGTCQRGLDYAFNTKKNLFSIFLEDDVFLAKNALHWFNYFYSNNMLSWNKYKFITAESIFYDTQNMDITPKKEILNQIKAEISKNNYQKYYYEINNFLTSSIFATTKEIWNTDIRKIRGSMNGECTLNDVIQKNKWKSIFPVVPFAKDIGMTHDDGWSVAWNGKNGVREIKNTYLLSDEFETPDEYIILPENFDKSVLYHHLNQDSSITEVITAINGNRAEDATAAPATKEANEAAAAEKFISPIFNQIK